MITALRICVCFLQFILFDVLTLISSIRFLLKIQTTSTMSAPFPEAQRVVQVGLKLFYTVLVNCGCECIYFITVFHKVRSSEENRDEI